MRGVSAWSRRRCRRARGPHGPGGQVAHADSSRTLFFGGSYRSARSSCAQARRSTREHSHCQARCTPTWCPTVQAPVQRAGPRGGCLGFSACRARAASLLRIADGCCAFGEPSVAAGRLARRGSGDALRAESAVSRARTLTWMGVLCGDVDPFARPEGRCLHCPRGQGSIRLGSVRLCRTCRCPPQNAGSSMRALARPPRCVRW